MLQMLLFYQALQRLIKDKCRHLWRRLPKHAEPHQPLQVREHRRRDLETERHALLRVRSTGHAFNYMIINL